MTTWILFAAVLLAAFVAGACYLTRSTTTSTDISKQLGINEKI